MNSDRIHHFEKLLASQPDNHLFRFSLAQALEEGGRLDDAITHYESCVASREDWMMPRILLGKLLLRAGRRKEARPLLAAALQLAIDQDHEDPANELKALLDDLGNA